MFFFDISILSSFPSPVTEVTRTPREGISFFYAFRGRWIVRHGTMTIVNTGLWYMR